MTTETTFDHAARRAASGSVLDSAGVDLAWFPTGADLEYLTGLQRRVPTFGDVNYTHGWVTGAFIVGGRDPVFLLPGNFVEFDLPEGVPGEVISVDEMDDGDALFARAAASLGSAGRIAIGARTPSFDTAVWSMGPSDDRDANVRISQQALQGGNGISFDFGAVLEGYCSDFGRTVHVSDPGEEYRWVYEVVMAAQQAGIDAVRPGVTASAVHRATRQVIVDAGYGDWFRHRTGHCIGLDVHEEPFISPEDNTPLEAGMTFTIEPSVFWPGRVGVRVEDIIVCTPDGGVKLNEYPTDLIAND